MRHLALCLFALLSIAAAPSGDGDTQLLAPLPSLDGAWKLLAATADGHVLSGKDLPCWTVTIEGNRARVDYSCEGIVEVFTFDFERDSARFRLGTNWYHGTYRLDGGLLHLSVIPPRSDATNGSRGGSFVLYRAK